MCDGSNDDAGASHNVATNDRHGSSDSMGQCAADAYGNAF